jgi:hypothetical protein
MNYKYIFIAGAPGSKWSSVSKNIYYSADIDRSDYSDARTYYHDAGGTVDLMHMGAYFDPGMEFGNFFDRLNEYTKEECEAEFDRPFHGQGIRIIKSHVFAHNIDFIKKTWPECPHVLVHRPDDACLGWWVKCGHFDITYPLYNQYYIDLKHMAQHIKEQNKKILEAWWKYKGKTVTSNRELATALNIQQPPQEYEQNYVVSNVSVMVL